MNRLDLEITCGDCGAAGRIPARMPHGDMACWSCRAILPKQLIEDLIVAQSVKSILCTACPGVLTVAHGWRTRDGKWAGRCNRCKREVTLGP